MSNHAKDLRKQLRNVCQEMAKDLITAELGVEVQRRTAEVVNARLDAVEAFVKDSLEKIDKRARAVEGFLTRTVKVDIQNDLYNANLTVDAVVQVLADAGLNIEGFAAKVDAKKTEIHVERQKAAGEKMQAEMAARAEAVTNAQQDASVTETQQPTASV